MTATDVVVVVVVVDGMVVEVVGAMVVASGSVAVAVGGALVDAVAVGAAVVGESVIQADATAASSTVSVMRPLDMSGVSQTCLRYASIRSAIAAFSWLARAMCWSWVAWSLTYWSRPSRLQT